MEENKPTIVLPFSQDRQDALLGYLLTDDQFFNQARNKIKPTWFLNIKSAKIYSRLLEIYEKYKRKVTLEEMKADSLFILENAPERAALANHLNACVNKIQYHGLDIIKNELTEWLHSVIFQDGVQKAATLFNAKKTHESYQHITSIVRELKDAKFDDGEQISFLDLDKSLVKDSEDFRLALTTGLSILDRALIADSDGGGLLPGDMTLLLASVNVGKSTAMISMIRHNILLGKKVLFMTHEGRPSDIRNKLVCSVLGCTLGQLINMYKTEEGLKKLQFASNLISKYLVYVPYNKPGMAIEDVEPIIRRLQESEMMSNKERKGFDLLVVDYPAKLTTRRASQGHLPQRISDHIVYEYYTQLALEYKFHVLCAIQTNREGSKLNKGIVKQDRFLSMEDVAESWGPMQSATNVISINRDLLSQQKNIITFYVCKSRSSQVGTAVVARSDFARALTHSNELGGLYYQANAPMSEKVDMLLEQYNNKELPTDLITISKEVE